MNDTRFGTVCLRVTELGDNGELGDVLVRTGPFEIGLEPVIEAGRTFNYPPDDERQPGEPPLSSYKEVDRFKHFEMTLINMRRFWRFDRKLWRLLKRPCVLEFWTVHVASESQDTEFSWIHWLLPTTKWNRIGYGRYSGQSSESTPISPSDLPDGETPITSGGWWKTADPPPLP